MRSLSLKKWAAYENIKNANAITKFFHVNNFSKLEEQARGKAKIVTRFSEQLKSEIANYVQSNRAMFTDEEYKMLTYESQRSILKYKTNWSKLEKGLSPAKVISLLGEPLSTEWQDNYRISKYIYPRDAYVVFSRKGETVHYSLDYWNESVDSVVRIK